MQVVKSAGDREFECDFGFVGNAGVCVPYEDPVRGPAPADAPARTDAPAPVDPPASCGKDGEPVCRPPYTGTVLVVPPARFHSPSRYELFGLAS